VATAGFTDSVVVSAPDTDTGYHPIHAVRGLVPAPTGKPRPAGQHIGRNPYLGGTEPTEDRCGRPHPARLTLITRPLISPPGWAGHGMAVASIMAGADLPYARMASPVRTRVQAH
jgi:hypothetical protein